VVVELSTVRIDKPSELNVILGQAHFIKTVPDLYGVLAGSSPHLRFGVAFCESSGARLVRRAGNDAELVELAVRNARAIGAGHSFVVFVREGFPVNVLNQLFDFGLPRAHADAFEASPSVSAIVVRAASWESLIRRSGKNGRDRRTRRT